MRAALDLDASNLTILRDIVHRHLPAGSRIFVFGSRATGRARPFSDIDLAIEAAGPLDLGLIGALRDELVESDLPYRVDLVDLATAAPGFRNRIAAHWIELPLDPA